ncbi:L,D-transpeptidase [Paenibacillus sp. JTLBN-2024]
MTILVDKQNHRLAVVSGNVMLRNYKVGLGGERTPEGRFAITDKVMNPNGRDDGEFGSRGMQLSDITTPSTAQTSRIASERTNPRAAYG